MIRRAVVVTLIWGLAGTGAFAAEPADAKAAAAAATDAPPATALATDVDGSLPAIEIGRRPERGNALPALYGSFAALQAYDAYSTVKGLQRGARESNPLVGGLAGNSAALWAIKGGVTATSIVMAERLWRQHRRGAAIATMVAANGVMAAVAARNAAVLRQAR